MAVSCLTEAQKRMLNKLKDYAPELRREYDSYLFRFGDFLDELCRDLAALSGSDGSGGPATGGISGGSIAWTLQTNEAIQYAGGFYDFATGPSGDDTFSPAITFGSAGAGVAAHLSIVLGGSTVDELTVRVSGTSITDDGVQTGSDSEDIVIPASTPINSYFETSKKWNGEVTIEAVSGTPVTSNYGFTKYFDMDNQDFRIFGLEALWEADSTDSGSDIQLVHHKSTGWTFVAGGPPTAPVLVSRNVDHAGNTDQRVGQGAWKRSNLDQVINGADSEGVLFCVQSGSTGIGSLSFRLLTLQLSTQKILPSET